MTEKDNHHRHCETLKAAKQSRIWIAASKLTLLLAMTFSQKPARLYLKEISLAYIAVVLAGFALIALPGKAAAIGLHPQSVVSDNTIRLGDIFSGLSGTAQEHKADRVLGIAPPPGEEMVLNARTLMRIAIALDLPWRPSSGAEQVVLRRAATIIDADMIRDALSNALTGEGLEGKFELLIPPEQSEMILPQGTLQSVEITQISFRPENNGFQATLAAPSKDNPVRTLEVRGAIQRLVPVPVLRAPLRNGDIVGKRDLSTIDLPANRLKHNIVMKAEDLIGTTPRRVLLAGKPVTTDDIEAPRIVQRGENVTMIFRNGSLVLTAQGKALEFGAKGDAVRVTNLTSSKTVEAVVSGEKEVTVNNF